MKDKLRGRIKLHNEELHNSYSSPNNIKMIRLRKMRWQCQVAHAEDKTSAYTIVVSKPEGKRSLGKPRGKWEYNIKVDLK
jgi:hypothetical protein